MKAKKITAKDIKDAMKIAIAQLGEDAIIVSKKTVPTGVEVIAAREADYEAAKESLKKSGKMKGDVNIFNYTSTASKPTGDMWSKYETSKTEAPADPMGSYHKREIEKGRRGEFDFDIVALKESIKGDTTEVKDAVVSEVADLKEFLMDQFAPLEDLKMIRESFESAFRRNKSLSPANAVYEMLYARMERLGISEDVKVAMVAGIDHGLSVSEAWRESLVNLSKMVKEGDRNPIAGGGIFAFLGATGVGKTTTIGKLATQYVMDFGNEDIALVTTDAFKIASFEQLKTFGRILDIPVHVVSERESLSMILNKLDGVRTVLVDTSGMSLTDNVTEYQNRMIDDFGGDIQKFIVLSASSQYELSEKSFIAHCSGKYDGLIISKADEASDIGAPISIAIENDLPIMYVTDGQKIPDDCHTYSSRELVVKAIEIAQKESDRLIAKNAVGKTA